MPDETTQPTETILKKSAESPKINDEFDNEKAQTIFGCVVLSFSSVKKQWVVRIISSI